MKKSYYNTIDHETLKDGLSVAQSEVRQWAETLEMENMFDGRGAFALEAQLDIAQSTIDYIEDCILHNTKIQVESFDRLVLLIKKWHCSQVDQNLLLKIIGMFSKGDDTYQKEISKLINRVARILALQKKKDRR
jgi:flagellar motor protein MotB